MKKDQRVFWHKFATEHQAVLKRVRRLLQRNGFELVLTYDDKGTCKDAFIVKK